MTSAQLLQYLQSNPDIPNATALEKEGYLDEFHLPRLWDPIGEALFVELTDGIHRVTSLETAFTTNWRLDPVDAEQIQELLGRFQAYFREVETFFGLA